MNRTEKYRRTIGRSQTGSFLALPHSLMEHPNFSSMSPRAVKLLLDLGAQYRGVNNGDLAMTWSIMEKRGWHSRDQLRKARQELLYRGFIVITRQGGRNLATLYALTWRQIDECGGKLDTRPTKTASNNWKLSKTSAVLSHGIRAKDTNSVPLWMRKHHKK